MKGSTQTVSLSSLRRHSVRQRQRSDEELMALAESWLAMPVHPIVVRPATDGSGLFDLADGNSRVDGLELPGVTDAEVFVTDEELSDDDLDTIGYVTAFHRFGLNCSEQAILVIRKRKAGMTNQEIAKTLSINPGWSSKLASLDACRPEVQEAARAGRIGPNEWAMIAVADDQLHALGVYLNGGNREALAEAVKPKPKGGGSTGGKTARVQIPLAVSTKKYHAAGVVSIASLPGQQIDYDAMRNLLNEALNAVNYAITEKLDIKTFQAAMKSKAAAAEAVASPELSVFA